MSGLTGTDILIAAAVVIVAVIVVFLLLNARKRLFRRRDQLLGELADKPVLNQDRAFNRLAMARREASILAEQGVNVHRAQDLIAQAQGAFDTRHYEEAYRLAQSAHEALVNARQQGSRTTDAPLPSSKSNASAPAPPSSAGVGSAAAPLPAASSTGTAPTPLPIPKNRAESQFQIRVLSDELAKLTGSRGQDPSAIQAADLLTQASATFDRAEYTDAFRLALKGRRALGGTVESLPPSAAPSSADAKRVGNGAGASPDVARTAETVAESERCPDCGSPALSGDSFCRGCGRPLTALTCPGCGAPRGAEESFCGRCGNRFP